MLKTRIAIADDHTLFRTGLVKFLHEHLPEAEVKIEASSGVELLEKMARSKVDLVLTDIQMPIKDGFEVARVVSRDYSHVPVIGLSMHSKLILIQKMLENGAKGYVLKGSNPMDLIQCIRKVLAGEMAFCKESAALLLEASLNKQNHKKGLTERDLLVLKMIYAEKTNEEIGKELGIGTRREQMLVQELMDKLGVKSRVGLVKWMIENGFG